MCHKVVKTAMLLFSYYNLATVFVSSALAIDILFGFENVIWPLFHE